MYDSLSPTFTLKINDSERLLLLLLGFFLVALAFWMD